MYGDLVRLTLFPAAGSPNPNLVPFIFTSYFSPKVEIYKYLLPSHFAFLWCVFRGACDPSGLLLQSICV